MKKISKKTKTLVSSFVSLGVAASLIASSTFALFTSESRTDIAITSGKVDVKATATITRAWSAEWKDTDYIDKDLELSDNSATFTNGGTAGYSDGTLSLNNISPGDGVEFAINVQNESSIAIKYQMRIAIKDTILGAHGEKLGDQLKAEIEDSETTGGYGAITGKWSDSIEPTAEIEPFKVKVYLPIETENAYQELSSELTIGVYAVQGNASDNTPLADVIVNSSEGLHEALEDFAKSEETDIVLGLMSDTAISDEAPLAVPANKNITLDVNGNTVDVSKETKDGESLVVPEGSTLTTTDSDKSEGGEGGFHLFVKADAGNWSNGPAGKYALRVEDDSTLNLNDVQFTISDTIEDPEAKANHAVYVGGGTLNCNTGTKIEYTGKNFSDGFLIREGGTMNITGTTIHSEGAVGQITVGYLSYAEEKSTVNINEGTVIEYENANSFAGAIIVYQTGNVNIHEGASIEVCGDVPDAVAAIRVVGGGNVVMDGGTINLETTKQNGWAYAIMVLGNSYADPEVCDGKYVAGQEVNAHIEFKGNAQILVNEHAIIFAAQKNYRLEFTLDSDGIPNSKAGFSGDFIMDNGKLVPTIIIRDGVTIMAQDKVVKKGDSVYSQDERKPGTMGTYTPDAIDDQRVFD